MDSKVQYNDNDKAMCLQIIRLTLLPMIIQSVIQGMFVVGPFVYSGFKTSYK